MNSTRNLMVLGICLISVGALAQTADDTHAMDGALRAVDAMPTRAEFDAAFEDAPALLRAAALQTERTTYERQRAITMLSMYPTDENLEFLRSLLADQDPEIRGMAAYTAGRAYGTAPTQALIAVMELALQDHDTDVKKWALRGLRWVRAPRATQLLNHYASQADAALAGVAKTAISARASHNH